MWSEEKSQTFFKMTDTKWGIMVLIMNVFGLAIVGTILKQL